MQKVEVMEFDKAKRKFIFLQMVDLVTVPNAGDKIVFKISAQEIIFRVYDVHYSNNNNHVKVNVIRLSTLENYNSSGFSDITYYQ